MSRALFVCKWLSESQSIVFNYNFVSIELSWSIFRLAPELSIVDLGVRLNASRLTVKLARAPPNLLLFTCCYLPASRKNLKLQTPPDLKHRPIRNTSKNPWLDIRSGALNSARTVYEDWRYTIRIAFLISFLKRALRERCQGLWQLRIRYVCLISIWLYVNDVGGFLVSITLLREVLWAYTWQLTFNGNGTDLTFDAQNSNEGNFHRENKR